MVLRYIEVGVESSGVTITPKNPTQKEMLKLGCIVPLKNLACSRIMAGISLGHKNS